MKIKYWPLIVLIPALLVVTAPASSASLASSAKAPSIVSTVKFPWGTFKLAPWIASKIQKKQTLNYVLSIEGTGIPIFGAAMKTGWDRGAMKDSSRIPISPKVIGPVNTDIPTQVSQINSLLQAHQIDCLAFEAHSPGPYVSVFNQAMAEGVPVFGVNADSPNSHRIAFYALNEKSAGEAAGKLTGELIKKQGLKITKAAAMSGAPEGPYSLARISGFMQGLKEVVPSITWTNTPATAVKTLYDPATVYSTAKSFLTGNSNVQLIFHADQGVELVGKAIKDLGLTGKVWAAGFNVSPGILDEIIHGQLLVSMGQGWNLQAEAGEHACTGFLLDAKVPKPGLNELKPVPITQQNAAALKKTVTLGGA